MRFRQHDHHRFLDQGDDRKPVAIDDRRPDERDVDLAALQGGNQMRRVTLLRREDDAGIALAVGANDTENKLVNIGCAGKAQVNASCLAPCVALHAGRGPFHLFEDSARLTEQKLPGLGEFDAARAAVEEGCPDLVLKVANLQAERRLLDAEPFGRTSKMQLLGDRDEIAEMPEFHGYDRL